MKNLIYLIILTFLIYSCKKEVPEIPVSNSPEFIIQGHIANEDINFIVGENTELSFENSIENGVDKFKSVFSNGEQSFTFEMFSGDLEKPINITDLLQLNELKFAAITGKNVLEISKDYFNNSAIQEIRWYVNDNYFGKNQLEISRPGKYNICGLFIFQNGEEKTICNEMILGFQRQYDLNVTSYIDSITTNYSFESNTIPNEIQWIKDGQIVSTNALCSIENADNQVHEIELVTTFANGITKKRKFLHQSFGEMNVKEFGNLESTTDEIWDYNCIITYKKDNVEYVSFSPNTSINPGKISLNTVSLYQNDYVKLEGLYEGNLKSKASAEEINVNLSVKLVIKL